MDYYSSMEEKKPTHPNRLTQREKVTLAAMCDTIIPAVDVSGRRSDDLVEFYGTSASMVDVPDKFGRLLSGEVYHPVLYLARLALFLLSTWWGTFLMCGRPSLTKKFPYFQKFASVDQSGRERILLSWSFSSFFLYRMLFKTLKYLTVRLYFSGVNDKNSNPSWKAIGYCGPDPAFTSRTPQQNDKTVDCVGPLHPSLLHVSTPPEVLSRKLNQAGFPLPTLSSSSPLTLHCDAVVVGSGSGGSVVASILASAGHKVLVLEKGGYFARAGLSLQEGPSTKQMYEGQGLIATDDLGTVILAGSTVGGGSTINWSACIRTPDHVRTEWREKFHLDLFGDKMFDEALDVVCDKMGVQSDVDEEGFNNAVLRKGCEELGYHVSRVPCNAPADHYCGWCHLGCRNGKKQSTQETWLRDLADSGNGLILPGLRAVKIVKDRNNVARGVIAESACNNQQFVIESKVTVIACGALNTPGLLKRSGLKNKNIGRNLHLHPVVMAWGYFPAKSANSWPEDAKKSYQGGILTSMSAEVANFDTSGYGAIIQTPALHPGMFSVLTPWTSADEFRERMLKFPRTAHIFALARDKGTGTVDYPWTVTHRLEREDEENLVRGLEVILKVLVAAGAEEVGTQHCRGERVRAKGNDKGIEGLIEDVRSRGLKDLATPICSAHQMGSCRMGATPEKGAVKPNGETWEVKGLFVADTSVFPTAVGVNPMVTAQAVAYCTAQSVLETLKRGREEANSTAKII